MWISSLKIYLAIFKPCEVRKWDSDKCFVFTFTASNVTVISGWRCVCVHAFVQACYHGSTMHTLSHCLSPSATQYPLSSMQGRAWSWCSNGLIKSQIFEQVGIHEPGTQKKSLSSEQPGPWSAKSPYAALSLKAKSPYQALTFLWEWWPVTAQK